MITPPQGERIAKFLAHCGVCSRRDGEAYITQGRVKCNGVVVTSPVTFIGPTDRVEVDGAPVTPPTHEKLWLFYKPVGLITTHKDPQGRTTVFEYAQSKGLPRVVSVGRLDINSEGLLLLTTSSRFAHAAEKPATGWERTYRVRVFGQLPINDLLALKNGITLDGIHYGPITVEIEAPNQSRNQWIYMTLTEGKNREIRKILNHFGLQVNRLIRVRYGPYDLQDLKPGEFKSALLAATSGFI
jgi:23S rRNA pseudouridine2605 synthase